MGTAVVDLAYDVLKLVVGGFQVPIKANSIFELVDGYGWHGWVLVDGWVMGQRVSNSTLPRYFAVALCFPNFPYKFSLYCTGLAPMPRCRGDRE